MTAAIITYQINATIASVLLSPSDKSIAVPPIPAPNTLKGVDDLIHAGFEAYRNSCFNWLLAATGLVVVGLIFEGPELWHEITSIVSHWRFTRRFRFSLPENNVPNWAKLAAFIGWLFIVVGVAGEYVADSFVSRADGYVQTFDEILLTEARKESAHAEATARGFDAQIAESNAKAKSADATAKGFEAEIADAKARAAQAELELAKFKAPRELSVAQQQRIISKCKKFPGTPFIFLVNPTPEAVTFLAAIEDILVSSCRWSPQSDDVFGFAIPTPKGYKARMKWGISGIGVMFSPERASDFGPPARALAEALIAEGVAAGATANSTADNKAIYVLVGQKP